MNTENIRNITIDQLKTIYQAYEMPISKAKPYLCDLAKEYKVSDTDIMNAFRASVKIFNIRG